MISMLKKSPLRKHRLRRQQLQKQHRLSHQLRRQQWYLLLPQPKLQLAALQYELLPPLPAST